jgi:hypothetical protein
MKPHPHAALMAEYAKDAAETETPWERWEFTNYFAKPEWIALKNHPVWLTDEEYRRKPRTIRIGDYDVPEPMREEPEKMTLYYRASIEYSSCVAQNYWRGDSLDYLWLERGHVHATQEAAEIHAKALISLTAKP